MCAAINSPLMSDLSTPLTTTSMYASTSNGLDGLEEQDYTNASCTSSIVEITDCDSGGSATPYHTTAILKRCRQQVLKPYWKLLFLIGWRPFGRDRINYHYGWRVLNVVYPVLLAALMFYVYTYKILSCQGKYDIPLNPISSVPFVNISPTALAENPNHNHSPIDLSAADYHVCVHLITSYILPDILHLMAFLLGFWYFRVQDNEQMDALIQQAFLHATPVKHGLNTQTKMVKAMKWILVGGALWVAVTIGLQVMFLYAFGLKNTIYPFFSIHSVNVILLCLQFFGCFVYNAINTAVVVNYAVQCETIICFVRSIQEHLLEKTTALQMIMHDILKVWQATQQLNGPMAKMMSICLFNFTAMVVVGLSVLLFNYNSSENALVTVYHVFFLLVWLAIFVFPFIQAARLSSAYDNFQQASLEMRVFGYQTSPPQELDSFMQFVSTAKCKVRLMFIPVRSANFYGLLLFTGLLLLILIQTGLINVHYILL